MSPGFTAIVLGALGGLALVCVLLAVLRPAPVNLAAAVAALDERLARRTDDLSSRGRWETRMHRAARLAARSSNRWWGIPAGDLDVLDLTAEGYVARRVAWACGAIAAVAAAAAAMWLGGLGLPVVLVVAAVVVAVIAGSMVPVLAVRDDAARAREGFRRATAAYLDLVAQERATGRAPSQALVEAAAVGARDSCVFARISRALAHATRAGRTPWESLSRLGKRMDVVELVDLADILVTAADGAAVYATLLAKAAALRAAALAADKADANSRSQRVALPVALLLIALLLLVLYPAMIRLLTGG